ncbi:peroxiredoxin [Mycobacterium sp. C31M]
MLQVGTTAPDFTLKDQNGRPVTLSALRPRNVLLVFFPLAFTPICQGELGEIRDRLAEYQSDDTAVLAISVGPPPTHKTWAAEHGFDFPLLSDFWPHGAVARSYGVFNDATGYPNRGTFAIDADGVIRFAEVKDPGVPREPADWRRALEALRSG